jgi:hypothetical protein
MMMRNCLEKLRLPSNPTEQGLGLRRVLFVLVAVSVITFGSQAQEKQEKKKDAAAQQRQEKKTDADKKKTDTGKKKAAPKPAAKKQAVPQPMVVRNQWTDENFDQWIFNQDRNAAGARRRLDSSLTVHIEAIDRTSQLTDAQRKKLQLAGRGDLKRFFDRYETVKQKFHLLKDDEQKMQREIWQDISPLQMSMQAGLFDGDSLFYKSLRNTLSSEQWAKYDAVERERVEFSHRTSIVQAVAGWEQNMPLRAAQRRELIALLTKETKPPRKLTPYGNTWVLFQLGRLPQEKLKPIFDDMQWRTMNQYLVNSRNLGAFVKQLGLSADDEEADRADAQPAPAKK